MLLLRLSGDGSKVVGMMCTYLHFHRTANSRSSIIYYRGVIRGRWRVHFISAGCPEFCGNPLVAWRISVYTVNTHNSHTRTYYIYIYNTITVQYCIYGGDVDGIHMYSLDRLIEVLSRETNGVMMRMILAMDLMSMYEIVTSNTRRSIV